MLKRGACSHSIAVPMKPRLSRTPLRTITALEHSAGATRDTLQLQPEKRRRSRRAVHYNRNDRRHSWQWHRCAGRRSECHLAIVTRHRMSGQSRDAARHRQAVPIKSGLSTVERYAGAASILPRSCARATKSRCRQWLSRCGDIRKGARPSLGPQASGRMQAPALLRGEGWGARRPSKPPAPPSQGVRFIMVSPH